MNKTQNNTKIKCLITDFDETFFRTAIAADLKKSKPIDWGKIYSLIPQFEMYPGWKEVMTWLKENNIKFAVVSQSTREQSIEERGVLGKIVGMLPMSALVFLYLVVPLIYISVVKTSETMAYFQ